MSDVTDKRRLDRGPTAWRGDAMKRRLARRYRQEKLFKAAGLASILLAAGFLLLLLGTVAAKGVRGFTHTFIALEVHYDPARFDDLDGLSGDAYEQTLYRVNFAAIVREAMQQRFSDVTRRRDVRALMALVSSGARDKLRQRVLADPDLIGKRERVWLPASDDIDVMAKGYVDRAVPQSDRRLSDQQLAWYDALNQSGEIDIRFNADFVASGDSREPELAGILGATIGSFLTLAVTLAIAFPVGVASAIYLEEFAPQNRFTDLLEVNINNLAAVPSIVFGLLGLAVFLGTFGLPRSAPLVGGLTLALMTLPTIIISARAAIKAVPPSIRDAARGLGASPVQVVFHHVVPLALPGILTGTIIGMAQALGETAPLLMIGMVAFIVDVPGSISDAATVLPVQIFLWADSPERAFEEKTSAAIMVLLGFLVAMNALAIFLRNRFERRW